MNKTQAISLIALLALCFLSFKQDEKNEYFRQYYDENCHCVIRENLDKGRLLHYEELDSVSLRRNGLQVHFYNNGDTMNVAHYINDQHDGLIYTYYQNGKLGAIGHFKNDKRIGIWKIFTQNGDLEQETIYDSKNTDTTDANYTVKHYGANETLVYVETFKDDKRKDTEVSNQELYNKMFKSKEEIPGKKIYMANCAPCHNPNRDAVGPKSVGVTKRHTDKWLREWITNPAAMIARGEPAAYKLYITWNKTSMPAFSLSSEDMDKLIEYLGSLKK